MISEPRPLWKILIQTATPNAQTPLSCADCFAILEYLADVDVAGADRNMLVRAAQKHLATCPDCQEYYQRRLLELEALYEV